MIPKTCGHGKKLKGEECVECQLVWYLDSLKDAQRRTITCIEQIIKLAREGKNE